MSKKKVEFTVNVAIHGMKKGQSILLDVDANGIPLDRKWRRRLKDAKIDGCITETPKQPQTKTSSEKEK